MCGIELRKGLLRLGSGITGLWNILETLVKSSQMTT